MASVLYSQVFSSDLSGGQRNESYRQVKASDLVDTITRAETNSTVSATTSARSSIAA